MFEYTINLSRFIFGILVSGRSWLDYPFSQHQSAPSPHAYADCAV